MKKVEIAFLTACLIGLISLVTTGQEMPTSNLKPGFKLPERRVKINPLPPGHIPPPVIAIKSILDGIPRTTYTLEVLNRAKFGSQAFQSLKNVLPATACENGMTDARIIAYTGLVGKPSNALRCTGLWSMNDLANIKFQADGKLKDRDRLRVILEDRASGQQWVSDEFAVGWFAVDRVLLPGGCKYFLGRAGHYICTSDQGFKTCENLRDMGKPIRCERSGKKSI